MTEIDELRERAITWLRDDPDPPVGRNCRRSSTGFPTPQPILLTGSPAR
jgi:hypothetical protein